MILLLLPIAVGTQEAPLSVDCYSIALILAHPKVCDNQPVRITGKVVQIDLKTSKPGNPYTEFTLADRSKQLRFFSFDHLQLEKGACVQVEGVFKVQREVGPKNQVVVEKKTVGIAPVPCLPEMQEKPKVAKAPVSPSENKKVEKKQKVKEVPSTPSSQAWSWSEIISVGTLILILLAVVANRMTPHRMGRAFEEYVIGLFPDPEWEIEDRSSDTSSRIGRRVTGDVSYDCIVKHRRTSRRFIVQCKYRSRFFRKDNQEGIECAKPYQIRNYRAFQRTKGWPYVVIIGVGGRPRHPQHLFVLPLEHLGDTFILKAGLEVAGRNPHTPFTVDNQGMLG